MSDEEIIKWLFGLLSTIIVGIIAWVRSQVVSHSDRLAILETKMISEQDVRKIVHFEIEHLHESLDEIKKELRSNGQMLTDLRVNTGYLLKIAHGGDDRRNHGAD